MGINYLYNELVDMAIQCFKQAQGLYMTACRLYDFMAGFHPEEDYNNIYELIHKALTQAYMEVYDGKK